jgi:hypothetical protein
MEIPPSQARKVAASLGVITLICAIVANVSTSNLIFEDSLEGGATMSEEIGIWRSKSMITGSPSDLNYAWKTEDTKCNRDGYCLDTHSDSCCTSRVNRCKSLKAFAILGVCTRACTVH